LDKLNYIDSDSDLYLDRSTGYGEQERNR